MFKLSRIWRGISRATGDRSDQASPRAEPVNLLRRKGWKAMAVRQGDSLLVLLASEAAPDTSLLSGASRHELADAVRRGDIRHLKVARLRRRGLGRVIDGDAWLNGRRDDVKGLVELLFDLAAPAAVALQGGEAVRRLNLVETPFLGAFVARGGSAPEAPPDPIAITDDIWTALDTTVGEFTGGSHPQTFFLHLVDQRLSLIPVPADLIKALEPMALSAEAVRLAIEGGASAFVEDISGGDTTSSMGAVLANALAKETAAVLERYPAAFILQRSAPPPVVPPTLDWPPPAGAASMRRRAVLLIAVRYPRMLAGLKLLEDRDPNSDPIGFPVGGPLKGEPTARRRSVVFLNQCYYNFTYLAQALRKRGWDAVALSLTDPDHPQERLFHGADLRLFDRDWNVFERKIRTFLADNAGRFGVVHSYGQGAVSFFPPFHENNKNAADRIAWDILEMKRQGALLGYSHSGCMDMVSQTTFSAWSQGMCDRCVWQDRPDVCSDISNLAWGWKINTLADLICVETDPVLDYKGSPKVFRDPLTFALDGDVWHPDLPIPAHLRRHRTDGDVVIFHAVGNYTSRTKNGLNVKGTKAVTDAIDRLAGEGLPVRLDFAENIPSTEMRFVQVQADIIVDQLSYGRYGAAAREAMMLGKPVVGRVDKTEPGGGPPSQCIVETPIVPADEQTVYAVLKDLVLDADKRRRIGETSRQHALYWWSAPNLAERFERVYDIVRDTGHVPFELS